MSVFGDPGAPMVLLPMPQRLQRGDGVHRLRPGRLIQVARSSLSGRGDCVHRLRPGRLIQVAGGDRAALLRIGTAVRDALAEAGASWQLTAHGGSGAEIGATVAVDPARVSRAQGYLLAVGRERIEIVGHDEAGMQRSSGPRDRHGTGSTRVLPDAPADRAARRGTVRPARPARTASAPDASDRTLAD